MFCFASFLLVCNQNTYFYFEGPSRKKQLPEYKEYVAQYGSARDQSVIDLDHVTLPLESLANLSQWSKQGNGKIAEIASETKRTIKFVSDEPSGCYLSKCLDVQNLFGIRITVQAKGLNIVSGDTDWKRFVLLGRFLNERKEVIRSGADLVFDSGTYDWRTYSVDFELPHRSGYYCVTTLGFSPSARGIAWLRNFRIDGINPKNLGFKREFKNATVRINVSSQPDSWLHPKAASIVMR